MTVNFVSPGPVSTDIGLKDADEKSLFAEVIKMTRAAESFGTVQDIADIILVFSSKKGKWITASTAKTSSDQGPKVRSRFRHRLPTPFTIFETLIQLGGG